MRKALDHGNVGGNDKGTGGGGGAVLGRGVGELKLVRVVGHNHAYEEDAEAVEEEDTVKG